MQRIGALALVGFLSVGTLASCSDNNASEVPAADAATEASPAGGDARPGEFATISAQDAAGVLDDAPADLVVLDVRTPEEFAEGHLNGAVLVDFYDADFADQLAELDPDVTYVVYCRSGNRSGQTLPIMQQLGFTSAADIDGGILAWESAGYPVVD